MKANKQKLVVQTKKQFHKKNKHQLNAGDVVVAVVCVCILFYCIGHYYFTTFTRFLLWKDWIFISRYGEKKICHFMNSSLNALNLSKTQVLFHWWTHRRNSSCCRDFLYLVKICWYNCKRFVNFSCKFSERNDLLNVTIIKKFNEFLMGVKRMLEIIKIPVFSLVRCENL